MNAPIVNLSLWSGRPDARSIAFRVCQIGGVGLYFLVLLADGALAIWRSGGAPATMSGESKLLAMGGATLAIQALLAWLLHRTTRYQITAHEVVLRYGVALPRQLVIPFGAITEVKLRINRDRTGDLVLRLKEGQMVGYLKLWPHVRALSFMTPQPMLRSLPEPGVVASRLCRAIAAEAATRDAVRQLSAARDRPEALGDLPGACRAHSDLP